MITLPTKFKQFTVPLTQAEKNGSTHSKNSFTKRQRTQIRSTVGTFMQLLAIIHRERKFPSYLRRAAIQDAIGIVSSFVTRWEMWKRGERRHRLR